MLVTDNGTEFIKTEIITLCHLIDFKHKPRTSCVPWTNGLVEGMNRLLQEFLRCIINGNDTPYTEWSTDVKLFLLSFNSQITTTLGLSPRNGPQTTDSNNVYSKFIKKYTRLLPTH